MFGIERGRLFDESRGKDLACVIMRGGSFSVSRKDVVTASFLQVAYGLSRKDVSFIERSLCKFDMKMGYQESVAFIHGFANRFGNVLGDSFTGEESDLERMGFMQVWRYVVMPDREREYMKLARLKWRRINESLTKEGRITCRNWKRMIELQFIIWKLAGDDGTFSEYIQKSKYKDLLLDWFFTVSERLLKAWRAIKFTEDGQPF